MFHYCKDITWQPDENSLQTAPGPTHVCEFCDNGWESESEVLLHKKSHSDTVGKLIEKGKFVCWTCIKTFKSKEALCKHIRTIHFLSSDSAVRIEREIFICNDCETVFFNKQMLIIHIMNFHRLDTNSRVINLHCPNCMKVGTLQYLKAHFHTHLMHSILTCPICFVNCRNWTNYEIHTNKHPKYCYCNICDYSASNINIFNKHCEKHLESSSNIPLHKQKYDVKRFFVPHTREGWKYQNCLSHRGLKLQNELKICILCREICQNQKEMVKHLMRHTQIWTDVPQKTEFSCECGQLFNYKILLKQHQTKCNKEKEVPIEETDDLNILVIDSSTQRSVTLGPEISLTPLYDSKQNLNDTGENNYQYSSEVSSQVEVIQLNKESEEMFPEFTDDGHLVVLKIEGKNDGKVASTSEN